jgi:hypothetical protein
MSRTSTFAVGTVVAIKEAGAGLFGLKPGALGVCYEDYGTGSSFIFENGDYDGFNVEEQEIILDYVGMDNTTPYEFKNVMKLSADFRDSLKTGRFDFNRIRTVLNIK